MCFVGISLWFAKNQNRLHYRWKPQSSPHTAWRVTTGYSDELGCALLNNKSLSIFPMSLPCFNSHVFIVFLPRFLLNIFPFGQCAVLILTCGGGTWLRPCYLNTCLLVCLFLLSNRHSQNISIYPNCGKVNNLLSRQQPVMKWRSFLFSTIAMIAFIKNRQKPDKIYIWWIFHYAFWDPFTLLV